MSIRHATVQQYSIAPTFPDVWNVSCGHAIDNVLTCKHRRGSHMHNNYNYITINIYNMHMLYRRKKICSHNSGLSRMMVIYFVIRKIRSSTLFLSYDFLLGNNCCVTTGGCTFMYFCFSACVDFMPKVRAIEGLTRH